MNESDYNSPGYEYLRSYQSMSNLYFKLLALDYRKKFCLKYRCPTIHEYYFSMQNDNSLEQQFIYFCLCAWLIKDICKMNLELEPEEYKDPNLTVSIIIEALKFILINDYDEKLSSKNKNFLTFPPSRLKAGFGPEVIWTLNVFADRGLQLMLEELNDNKNGGRDKRIQIVYHDKNNNYSKKDKNNFITIESAFIDSKIIQSKSHIIDDNSLLFDDETDNKTSNIDNDIDHIGDEINFSSMNNNENIVHNIETDKWYEEIKNSKQKLNFNPIEYDDNNISIERNNYIDINFSNYSTSLIQKFSNIDKLLQDFNNKSKSILNAIRIRIDRHLQTINSRESFLRKNLQIKFDKFLFTWRNYKNRLDNNSNLKDEITKRIAKFDSHNEKINHLNIKIKNFHLEMNDTSKLNKLETMINKLREENENFDLKIAILLTLYAREHKKIIEESKNHK